MKNLTNIELKILKNNIEYKGFKNLIDSLQEI